MTRVVDVDHFQNRLFLIWASVLGLFALAVLGGLGLAGLQVERGLSQSDQVEERFERGQFDQIQEPFVPKVLEIQKRQHPQKQDKLFHKVPLELEFALERALLVGVGVLVCFGRRRVETGARFEVFQEQKFGLSLVPLLGKAIDRRLLFFYISIF